MTRLRSIASLSIVALTITLFCLTPSYAKKPDSPGGGGGGGGGVPAGVVYFHHDGDVWSMSPDGSNRVRYPNVTEGDWSFSARRSHPSYFTHAGERWFVRIVPVNPVTTDFEVQAISESGASVLLFTSADADILSPPIWTPGDGAVSFIGQRWELDESGDPLWIADAGLYVIDIAYDGSGAVVGSVPGSLTLVADLSQELRADLIEGSATSWGGHSWYSDGSMFTFGVRISESSPFVQEIWIVDLLQVSDPYAVPPQALLLLDSGGGVGWPEWSPDGQRIAYVSWEGTVVVERGGRTKTLRSSPNDSWGSADWSPDGSHFVVDHWDNFSGYDGIYRFSSSLRGKTELTDGLCPPDANFDCVLQPLGWRD